MKVLGMGLPELLIILAVALLIFGPKHLPKLGSAVGATVKNLRDGLSADKDDVIEEIVEDEAPAPRKKAESIEGTTAKKATAKSKPRAKVKESVE